MAKLNVTQIRKLFEMTEEAKRQGVSLSEVFEKFANEVGKAKGSIRNFYYSTLKTTKKDANLKGQYLNGKDIEVSKIVCFTKAEEEELLKKILLGVACGKSVRRSIFEITKNQKEALRYQNKYRNLLKNDKDKVDKIKLQIESEYGKKILLKRKQGQELLNTLKREINFLCEKIAKAEKIENAKLRLKVKRLEEENMQLKVMAYQNCDKSKLVDLFKSKDKLTL